MKQITCEKILLQWLKDHTNHIIAHHDIDMELPIYGKINHYTLYSSATYHRVFCWIKNDEKLLRENELIIDPLIEGCGKVNKWKVQTPEQIRMAI